MPKCPFCREHKQTGDELQDHFAHKHPEEIIPTSGIPRNQNRKFKSSKKQPIVVDGNNIAYISGNPEINKIKKARASLMKQGYRPIIFVSAALRHDIDKPMELNRLINLGWIIEVESGEDDDVMIIEEAQRKKCLIVSNDNFNEYVGNYKNKNWNIKSALKNFQFKDNTFTLKN